MIADAHLVLDAAAQRVLVVEPAGGLGAHQLVCLALDSGQAQIAGGLGPAQMVQAEEQADATLILQAVRFGESGSHACLRWGSPRKVRRAQDGCKARARGGGMDETAVTAA